MWQVILTKNPIVNAFRDDFFPRKVHYKKEARDLQKEVIKMGGTATIKNLSTGKETK